MKHPKNIIGQEVYGIRVGPQHLSFFFLSGLELYFTDFGYIDDDSSTIYSMPAFGSNSLHSLIGQKIQGISYLDAEFRVILDGADLHFHLDPELGNSVCLLYDGEMVSSFQDILKNVHS